MATAYDTLFKFTKEENKPAFVTATQQQNQPIVTATVMLPVLTVAAPTIGPSVQFPSADIQPTPSADASAAPASDFTSILKSPIVLAGGAVVLGIGALLIVRKKMGKGKGLSGFSSRRKKRRSRR